MGAFFFNQKMTSTIITKTTCTLLSILLTLYLESWLVFSMLSPHRLSGCTFERRYIYLHNLWSRKNNPTVTKMKFRSVQLVNLGVILVTQVSWIYNFNIKGQLNYILISEQTISLLLDTNTSRYIMNRSYFNAFFL